MPNYLHAIFIYSLTDDSTHQVTDGTSDCMLPVFDAGGKYLYFTSSTDTGLAYGWLDMTSMERPLTRVVYVATLQAATASPLAPRGGFEKRHSGRRRKPDAAKEPTDTREHRPRRPPTVTIDFQGLQARAVPLPLPAANYVDLEPGRSRNPLSGGGASGHRCPHRQSCRAARDRCSQFDLKTRQVAGSSSLESTAGALSTNGEKLLYARGHDWFIADAQAARQAGPPRS